MDFRELVAARRSIRRFQARPIAEEQLSRVLRCCLLAPSAGNLQPYAIVVVRRAETRAAIADAALGQRFLAEAAALLVFLQDAARSAAMYGARGTGLYAVQDTAIACAYAQLAATELGIGSCWVGAFDPQAVARLVAAPAHLVPAALLALGYADEQPPPTARRCLAELVSHESCGLQGDDR